MTLDECVYSLADLLDELVDCDKALVKLTEVLSTEEFSVEEVIKQFTKDYVCAPAVYVDNLKEDNNYTLIDSDFDSL